MPTSWSATTTAGRTMEPSAPLPEFLVKRAKKTVLRAPTEGLRAHVMGEARPDA